jgi:hypothetical protein
MICDDDLPRVYSDYSLLQLLLHQREKLSLMNLCERENPEPKQALEVDLTLVQELDQCGLKFVGLKSMLLKLWIRAWTCSGVLYHPSWPMGKEVSTDHRSKSCRTTKLEKSQPYGDWI